VASGAAGLTGRLFVAGRTDSQLELIDPGASAGR